MKKLSILALSAVMSIAPAFAEVNSTATPAQTTTQEVDLSFALDDAENLQTKEMTTTEMQETEGAAGPWGAVIGGAISGISAATGGKNAKQIAAATAVGAASGFYGGWVGQVGGKVGTAIFGTTSVSLGVISGKF
ncbi:hypothetical protein AAX05_00295 [Moraxella bovoculi]|uniref:Glycine zipper family protein n=2 Tax=Moraxella bovoculi TaxID=386891 RepID=A0AAC8PU36_9GAMM|nr:hypothetical protein [Moraxella bovoculi]AKG06893.1 hypothetical protein AAX06_00295 [Moraxella bovoculi]AKG08882.1 hypothetical protein AAX05_00295 [Moraxella bovoculi]AKG10713.1 hypothetical protein AAX07_00295 [Moraxella bovoculi]AKG12752.1 hypothetical protein AAX11_00295 [Moraxella bovoculi]